MKAFKPFNDEEKALLVRMHATGIKGAELYRRFEGNPVYENLLGLRGKKAIQNALVNMRTGKVDYTKRSPEPLPVHEKKRIGRLPGRKTRNGKGLRSLKAYRKFIRTVPASTSPVPEPRFKFNNCPHCGCPLHGAQEGLRTEQELRGDQ